MSDERSEPVTIPEPMAAFLERATVAIAGTRDQGLVPHVHRVSGWLVGPERNDVTCLFAEVFTEHLLPSLRDNGQIAVTFSEVPSHETYQLKGWFVEARPVDARELELSETRREIFVAKVEPLFGFEAAALRAYHPPPDVAVRFAVREVFEQTPGPSAGRRLLPKED